MRYPLNSITVTGPFREVAVAGTGLPDSNGVNRHIGVDLRASVGTTLYAPGDGVVLGSYTNPKTGLQVIETKIMGKIHRFLHLSRRDVTPGQSFKEGQVIGLTGNSGNVSAHLHWDVRNDSTTYNSSLSNYIDPFSTVSTNKGAEMFNNDTEVKEAYMLLRGNEGSAGERAGWIGQSKQAFFKVALPEANGYRQQLTDVRQALANEQAKPAKEVIKEVVTIVEKPVEVIKIQEIPVEVIKEVEKPVTWSKVADFFRDLINKFLRKS